MITPENWYKQADICRQANNSETLPYSDVLTCKPFGGVCSMVKCVNNHKSGCKKVKYVPVLSITE